MNSRVIFLFRRSMTSTLTRKSFFLKKRLHLDHLSLYTILQILSVSLFEKKPILKALYPDICKNSGEDPDNQLELFGF